MAAAITAAVAGGLLGAGGSVAGGLLGGGGGGGDAPAQFRPSFDPLLSQLSLEAQLGIGGDPAAILQQQSPLQQALARVQGNDTVRNKDRQRAGVLAGRTPEQIKFILENRDEYFALRENRTSKSQGINRAGTRSFEKFKDFVLREGGLTDDEFEDADDGLRGFEQATGRSFADIFAEEEQFRAALPGRLEELQGFASQQQGNRRELRNIIQDRATSIGTRDTDELARQIEARELQNFDDVEQNFLRQIQRNSGANIAGGLRQLTQNRANLPLNALERALGLANQENANDSQALASVQGALFGDTNAALQAAQLRTNAQTSAAGISANQQIAQSQLNAQASQNKALSLANGVAGGANALGSLATLPLQLQQAQLDREARGPAT